jgi:hypothetical protein
MTKGLINVNFTLYEAPKVDIKENLAFKDYSLSIQKENSFILTFDLDPQYYYALVCNKPNYLTEWYFPEGNGIENIDMVNKDDIVYNETLNDTIWIPME